MIQHTVESGFL